MRVSFGRQSDRRRGTERHSSPDRDRTQRLLALVLVRLRIDRGKILEIERLYDRNINDAAFPLLTTPRTGSVNDVPPSERASRETLIRAANSYFDALEGDDGKIGAFAQDCIRHENGYQTVNNPPPGRRMMPSPMLPNPNTEQGKAQLAFSMQTCEQQISAPSPQGGKTFSYMKHILLHEAHPLT